MEGVTLFYIEITPFYSGTRNVTSVSTCRLPLLPIPLGCCHEFITKVEGTAEAGIYDYMAVSKPGETQR